MSQKIYSMITDRILDLLDNGVVPWKKGWRSCNELPKNLVSKKGYRGINTFLLASLGYGSPYFVSFKQAKQLGGNVRKGEKGFPVVFWKLLDKDNGTDENGEKQTKKIPLLRYYLVWNIEQCENIDPAKIPAAPEPNHFDPIEEAEAIVAGFENGPDILHMGGQPCYIPKLDQVHIPKAEHFHAGAEEYYSTIFHELIHSTGHERRLSRSSLTDLKATYGSETYSREELVAEMGAAFLCGHAGIEAATIENSAAYIDGWRKKISEEPNLVVSAAAQAQKAAEHVLGIKYDNKNEQGGN